MDQTLKVQNSLPGRGQADAAVTSDVIPAVDVQAVTVEAANAHAITVRIHTGSTDVDIRQQVETPDRLVDGHPPDLFGDVRHHLEVGKELLLLAPRLGRGVRHGRLAQHEPAAGHLIVVGKGLTRLGIPATLLDVEAAALQPTDVEERQVAGRTRREVEVVVPEPLQCLLVRQGALELGDLFLGVGEVSGGGDILGGDEVVTENLASEGVVGSLSRVATDEDRELGFEVSPAVGESLKTVLVGVSGVERIFHEAHDMLLLTGRNFVGHNLLLWL